MTYLNKKYEAKLNKYGQIIFQQYRFDCPSAFASYVKELGQKTKERRTNFTLSASGWTDVYYGPNTLDEWRNEFNLPKI